MSQLPFPWQDEQPLRFDRFMAAALFDTRQGYYSRRISGVGRGGDFTTTAMISPALGKAVAAWAAQAMGQTGCRHLIELGPGEGLLASAVRSEFSWWRRLGLQLHLVERSVPLKEKQAALLGSKVRWHVSIEDALAACGGKACIYSNEFADAFPVRCFRKSRAGWEELYLIAGNPASEIWKNLSQDELPDSAVFRESHPTGQVVEVHESFHQWWKAWLPLWRAGRMLTIDYGADSSLLYERRPAGSLRGYVHHQRVDGAARYANPGRQDLTADVNFSDLATWPLPHAVTLRLLSQRDFLLPFATRGDHADDFAINPHGAGEAFRVIEHQTAACAAV